MRSVIFVVNLLVVMFLSQIAGAAEQNYTVDNKGNVVFSVIHENLPVGKEQIHEAALKYLQEAYKDTRYEITYNDREKGIVVGNGIFSAFYESSNLISTKTFNVNFFVRVDAKDGRARIQFIAKQYKVTSLSDVKSNENEDVNIALVAPVADNNTNKKNYTKAFENLKKLVAKTLDNVSEAIKAAQAPIVDGEEW
mgnify:FL=1